MSVTSHSRAFAVILALVSTLAILPPTVRTQDRGLGVTGQRPGAERYHALVIGNNAYKTLPRLKTAEADAREVAALLKDFYGFETRLLLNATRQQIIAALSSYRQSLAADTSLLVYYAGHGFNDRATEKTYWLPVDVERDDTSNWIIADEITSGIRAIPARHVLVVSDSCYSGTLTRGLGEALPPTAQREQFLQRMAAGRSRTLMASGGDEPVADSGGGGHSVFAGALLRGLREMNKERFTAAELFRHYVEEAVAGRAEQTPEYNPLRNSGHESGDFVFVKVKTDGRTVEVTVSAPPSARVDPAAVELAVWNTIQNSADPEDFKDYLEKYPNGQFASYARRRLAALPAVARPAPATPAGGGAASNPPPANNTAARPSPARSTPGSTLRSRAGIELVYVPPGKFLMGSSNSDAQRAFENARTFSNDARREWFTVEQPQHQVTIREGFYMGRYEVTQAQWQAVMGTNPASFKGDSLPVETVSWNDAQEFIAKLNAQNDGFLYRLPSEAEWEYACRAGTTGDYAGSPDSMAWYGNNSGRQYFDAAEIWRTDQGNYFKRITETGGQTHPVGQKQANGFGLYDMHGNVYEWVQDYYHESYDGAPDDGSSWLSGGDSKYRGLRGGAWLNLAPGLRSALRYWLDPTNRFYYIGFRIVASPRQ